MREQQLMYSNGDRADRSKLEEFFIATGFYDLLPVALEMAGILGYDQNEIIEAICKVHDKFQRFPPNKNRIAWFKKVFAEKLSEALWSIGFVSYNIQWRWNWLWEN